MGLHVVFTSRLILLYTISSLIGCGGAVPKPVPISRATEASHYKTSEVEAYLYPEDAVVQDAILTFDSIQTFLSIWSEEDPDQTKKKAINEAVEKVRGTISPLITTCYANPVQKNDASLVQSDKAFVIALIEFKKKYVDLLAAVEPLGIRQYGAKELSKAPTELLVPSPEDIGDLFLYLDGL